MKVKLMSFGAQQYVLILYCMWKTSTFCVPYEGGFDPRWYEPLETPPIISEMFQIATEDFW